MSDLMFVRLREKNENEGESYDFWLQVNGNEEALQRLDEALEDEYFASESTFVLNMGRPRPEHEVDILVEETQSGYMELCQKFTGRLELPEGDDLSTGEWEDVLYKGSIKDYFTED